MYMKNVYLCIFWIVTYCFVSGISHATGYYQSGGGGGIKDCLDNISLSIQNHSFNNIYHSGISDASIKIWLDNFFRGRCWLYSIGVDVNTVTGAIFPVYHPRLWVIGFYEVYSGDYLSKNRFSLATFSKINPPYWILPHWFLWKNEAYVTSLKSPFSTAYATQWYSYLGRPMLVARDNSWLVVDVFIQSPLSNKNQMEIAKKYLWEYWYHQ